MFSILRFSPRSSSFARPGIPRLCDQLRLQQQEQQRQHQRHQQKHQQQQLQQQQQQQQLQLAIINYLSGHPAILAAAEAQYIVHQLTSVRKPSNILI